MQQMSSPKIKRLQRWREEYLALRSEIFRFDEDEDVFSLFKLNSKDLKYKGTIRRLQMEFNEDNFNRDLERNEILTQIQIMKREQGALQKRMDENWQNPRLANYFKSEASKLIQKQIQFKDFHGKNFAFTEEEKDGLLNFFESFNVDAYQDIDYNEEIRRKKILQAQNASSPSNQEKLNSQIKAKRNRKEFKSQEGLGDLQQKSYNQSKKSSSEDDEDEEEDTLQAERQKKQIKGVENKKKKRDSFSGDAHKNEEGISEFDKIVNQLQEDIFVTQDKQQKKGNGNQYLSKVSELPEEESRLMTQKLSSNIHSSLKSKQSLLSPKGNSQILNRQVRQARSQFVGQNENNEDENENNEDQIHEHQNQDIYSQQVKRQSPRYQSHSPEKKQFQQQEYPDSKYTTPKRVTAKNSPDKYNSHIREFYHQQYMSGNNEQKERDHSNDQNTSPSKQNLSLLDKSLNNISNIEEDQKDMEQIKDFVKRIDNMIKDIGGVNCGWKQEDHRSFLYLMKKYGQNGLKSKEAQTDSVVAVLQFYSEKEILQHINAYNQYNLLLQQKQNYIQEYKDITLRTEKRRQAELKILQQIRKERELSQLKERIHSTVQRTEFYVKQFEDIKKKYKDVESKASQEYQKRQNQREKEVFDMVQRRQTQKELLQAVNSKKSQQEIKKVNMVKEMNEKEKLESLLPKNQNYKISSANNERIMSIQKDLYAKMQQLEELRMQSNSKQIKYVYFTPQIKKKQYHSPQSLKAQHMS